MKKTIIFIFLFLISFFFLKTFCQTLPAGLPEDIADYTKWTRLNKKIIPPREGDAHRGYKRVYVNRLKSDLVDSNKKLIFPYPEGTIVVKEVKKDQKKKSNIVLVAIMRKLPGNENTGGWDFVEYTRSSQDGSFIPIAFPKESCYACHSGASDSDAVWTKFDRFK